MRHLAIAASMALLACGGGTKKAQTPVAPAPPIGECGDIATGGVVSANPDFRRADRDLDGDGRPEIVRADRHLCRGPDNQNCQWNVFVADGACHRYIGTIDGAAIELGPVGDRGFPELRSWWRLSAGERALLHVYQFGGVGYRLSETLMCRAGKGDQLQCASEDAL